MNFQLLKGLILLFGGIFLLLLTIYLRRNEIKENITNEYQTAKHFSTLLIAILMIFLGLNDIINSIKIFF